MKKKLILSLTFGFLFIGASWFLLSPYISKTWAIKQKIRQNQEKLEKMVRLSGQSAEWKNKLLLLQNDIQYLSNYLPKQKELNTLSHKLRSKAIDYNLNIFDIGFDHSFSLREVNSHAPTFYLKIVPLQVRLEGQFPNIYRYLEYLEKLPCFFGFDTLEILKKQKQNTSTFPTIQANMAINVLCLSPKRKSLFASSFKISNTDYPPIQISPSLITTQKNLRIRALGKNIFIPEQSKEINEYMTGNEIIDIEIETLSLMDLNVNGIVSYQGEYMALINNQRVKKGNSIAGMEVVWITKNRVCLAKDKKKIILNLNK